MTVPPLLLFVAMLETAPVTVLAMLVTEIVLRLRDLRANRNRANARQPHRTAP